VSTAKSAARAGLLAANNPRATAVAIARNERLSHEPMPTL
jgi:hypothetical protein